MKKMTPKNLYHIRCRFEVKTGVFLNAQPCKKAFPARKLWILAAAIAACLAMAAFTYPLFSSLDGDWLSLTGNYEGNGIVSIQVENRSDKKLEFQSQTRLMRWVTSAEVTRLEGEPVFENTLFPAHSSGIMTIDLSQAYDIQALEEAPADEWYYLLLTNNNFLFGQDWMCSVTFSSRKPDAEEAEETVPSVSAEPVIVEQIEAGLQFYFEESYSGDLFAFNGPNFQYLQQVDELLKRFEGTVVSPLGPTLMVGGPSEFLDPEPILGKPPEGVVFDPSVPSQQQYLLALTDWTYTDAYGRMVAGRDEKAWAITAILPQYQGQTDGGAALPLTFLFVYDAAAAKPENNTFIYGQLLSFAELEQYKVLEDDHYAIYNATSLIYTDVDAYLDDFLASRTDVYCDDQIRQRVHSIYNFYQNPENIQKSYGYLTFPD